MTQQINKITCDTGTISKFVTARMEMNYTINVAYTDFEWQHLKASIIYLFPSTNYAQRMVVYIS